MVFDVDGIKAYGRNASKTSARGFVRLNIKKDSITWMPRREGFLLSFLWWSSEVVSCLSMCRSSRQCFQALR